jgi:bifunctional UDP-N-acetylglucosamine pyrophosphorylase/glucosamine-1-phosphate N-acetyltransferase
MVESIGIVILAAGKGTRLKVTTPKVLIPLLGSPLIDHVIGCAENFTKLNNIQGNITIVVGHEAEQIRNHISEKNSSIKFAVQKEQKGTADALKCYFESNTKNWDYNYTLVLCGDTPLLRHLDFTEMLNYLKNHPDTKGVAATFTAIDPTGYGRIDRGASGFDIIEEKDCNEFQKKISEVNSAVYLVRTAHIKEHLYKIESTNKAKEYYLTDLFKKDFDVAAMHFSAGTSFQGINTLNQLAQLEEYALGNKINSLLESGVRFIKPESAYIHNEVQIKEDTIIYPNVVIEGESLIGKNCLIESGVVLKNVRIADNCIILAYSYLENCEIQAGSSIGPMARIRPGSLIGTDSKIGNFVEIKKSVLAAGVKVSHLSYVGDAEIGENTNIGCGFITCNYDGANKHKTIIGKNSFIGSDCQMIAPVEIGDEAYIGSGSTINKNVPDGAFAIARERQVTKEGMARKFIKAKK